MYQDVGPALQRARERQQDVERDAEAWKLLVETLREVENAEGAHLGGALAERVAERFAELTNGRYEKIELGPGLSTQDVRVVGTNTPEGALSRLSVGTREQLATLLRLAIAEALGSAIVLDDHLVQSDPQRLAWFRETLAKAAERTQVVVFTCRPEDYLGNGAHRVDLGETIVRWEPEDVGAAWTARSMDPLLGL